jgi:valyl-tRNA synthetase
LMVRFALPTGTFMSSSAHTDANNVMSTVKVMHGFRRFCNKIYQASKFCLGNFDKLAAAGTKFTPPKTVARTGKGMLSLLTRNCSVS